MTAASLAPTEPCSSSEILAVVAPAFPLPAPDAIVSVTIANCRDGFARVFAVPSNKLCGQPDGSCYDNEQVFLQVQNGRWTILDSGSGIDCSDDPRISEACKALGLN